MVVALTSGLRCLGCCPCSRSKVILGGGLAVVRKCDVWVMERKVVAEDGDRIVTMSAGAGATSRTLIKK